MNIEKCRVTLYHLNKKQMLRYVYNSNFIYYEKMNMFLLNAGLEFSYFHYMIALSEYFM